MSTKIEWTQETWNPVTGCTPISEGCRNCYAKRMAKRLAGRYGYPEAPHEFDVTLHPNRLEQPLHWKRPRTVFVCSMSDLFHKDVPDEFIDRVWATMLLSPQHTFQILTKRPKRMQHYLTPHLPDPMFPKTSTRYTTVLRAADHIRIKRPALIRSGISDPVHFPARHIWLGVSVEDQAAADERIPLLLQIPAAVRFVSCEPLLGPIDLSRSVTPDEWNWDAVNALQDANDDCPPEQFIPECEAECDWINFSNDLVENPDYREWVDWRKQRARLLALQRSLHWVIGGGESGPGARPMHPQWARDIRDLCQATSVPFFFKQWGALRPVSTIEAAKYPNPKLELRSSQFFARVGKHRAGRLLDGREWNEMPEVHR